MKEEQLKINPNFVELCYFVLNAHCINWDRPHHIRPIGFHRYCRGHF